MTSMLIGAHTANEKPLWEAEERTADLVQMFLSNPQSWRKPTPRDDAEVLAAAELPIYIHAPYLVNVGSPNNRVRIPSRKILADTLEAAHAIGAEAVIVHGGHTGEGEGFEIAADRWRKALDAVEIMVPILIENTAGGDGAIVRECENYGPLWEAIGHYDVGVCLDTCHAWAAGEDLATLVERVRTATGRVDLVHCNDSRDPHDSRRDRHANLGHGQIPEDLILAVVGEAGTPVIVETPNDDGGQAADIAWLRERV